jgi:hypothetical protein
MPATRAPEIDIDGSGKRLRLKRLRAHLYSGASASEFESLGTATREMTEISPPGYFQWRCFIDPAACGH